MPEQLVLNDLSSENLENELKNLSYIKKKMINKYFFFLFNDEMENIDSNINKFNDIINF